MIKQSNIYSGVGINKNYIFQNFKFHICLPSSGEYIYIYIYICKIIYIYINYIYIHKIIYIYIYQLDNRVYLYTIMYSYTVNVSFMLICFLLSELIIYCKYV